MFSEADAFLDAIFDRPDDDTPRLVYADWLDEHGQPNYAQFIRLQCAAAREKFWSPEANRLWEAIGWVWNRLLDEWWPATAQNWRNVPGNDSAGYRLDAVHFHRGFLLPSIGITFTQLALYRDCLHWMVTPDAYLLIDYQMAGSVAACPRLAVIRRLRIGSDNGVMDDGLSEFLESPFLTGLQVLDLTPLDVISQPSIETLLTAPGLSTVRELRITLDSAGGYDPGAEYIRLKARFPRVGWRRRPDDP
jgi:uncharacterized protein (TIGR02996 family)